LDFLKGFFSIVIIDHKSDKIFSCVDEFSIKPLYYFHKKNFLILSSNLSPILKNNFVDKDYDINEIINFVSLGREINNKTIFKNIKKFNCSTYSIFHKNKIISRKYWSPFKNYQSNFYPKRDYVNIISNKLDDVVNLWKTSDVKLSNTRSSGIDSNILNFYFKKNNIETKNFVIKENRHHQVENNEISVNFDKINLERELDKYLKNNFDPLAIGVSSNLTLFNLYKNISQKKFKVCFNGEGADEIFGGYSRYVKHLELIKKRNGNIYKSFLDLYKKEVGHTQYAINKKSFEVYNHLINQIKKIKIISKSNLNKILEFDQITWVPTLMKSHDAIGMFYSLEIRPPFLDNDLVRAVNNLPIEQKINESKQKIITKNILSKVFKHKINNSKIGTPSYFHSIINQKKTKNIFKEKIFDGKLSKFFDPIKTWEICCKQFKEKEDHIFLWRMFILSKILD
jgi:asparagine synthase (glutamine-hydrolysing)